MLFGTTSPIALLAGVAQIVTVNLETFVGAASSWTWSNSAGTTAFQPATGARPTSATGPNGGSNPITRAVEPANPYMASEATTDAGPWGRESPVFDASLGTFSFFFDYFARFGSEGGIADGTTFVEGWNGSAWVQISNSIVGSKQTSANSAWRASTEFGTYTSSGFSNADFQFRVRCVKGASEFFGNYDFCFDNFKVTGPGLSSTPLPPEGTARAVSLLLGNRTIFVSTTGNNANTGLTVNQPKRTIQNALSIAQRGDVVLIEDGIYYESLTRSNSGATVAEPILIAARNAGAVTVSNLRKDAFEGTATWIDRGSGVFGLAASERSYLGYDASGNLIPGYRSNSDINSTTIVTNVGTNVTSSPTTKPQYGMSFGSGEVRVKLKNGSNPTGQQIAITDGFRQVQLSLTNCPNTIVDGITFDGAGDTFAVSMDLASQNCVLTNCRFFTCQFGVKPGHNCLIDYCEYSQIGMDVWRRDLVAINGRSSKAIFRWAKNHYVGDIVGGNVNDALVEGGIDGGNFGATAAIGTRITGCWIHSAFEGSKIGRSRGTTSPAEVDNCRIERICDDAIEAETAGIGSNPSGQGEIRIHDNRISDAEVYISIQDEVMQANTRIYRNVFEVTDQDNTRTPFAFKTVRTPGSTSIQIYQNTLKHIAATGETTEGFGEHTIFFPFQNGGINGGLRCNVFRNNCIIYADLDQGDGEPNSGVINSNVLADDDLALWRSNGGSFEGIEANLLLDSNYVPAGGSPLAGAGAALPGGLPDSRGENTTVGCHEVGAIIDSDWPRVAAEDYRDTAPPRWTEPGA